MRPWELRRVTFAKEALVHHHHVIRYVLLAVFGAAAFAYQAVGRRRATTPS